MSDDPLVNARAHVLHDLVSTGAADATAVSRLEDAVRERRWWLDQWPDGAEFVTGLVAQDVQDALMATTRWPVCTRCDEGEPLHPLYVEPDLGGPDPQWVCEESGTVVAPVGSL